MHDEFHEIGLSWNRLRSSMTENLRSRASQDAGLWAVEVLENTLGSEWPNRAFARDRDLALAVSAAGSHLIAYAELLDLALRLHLLADAQGLAAIRKQLRQDMRTEAWRHAQLQLEVAALGRRCGAGVAIERVVQSRLPPVDVELVVPSVGTIRAETFVLFLDQVMRGGMDEDQAVGLRLIDLQAQHDITVAGQLPSTLTPVEMNQLFDELDRLAAQVATTGSVLEIARGDGRLRIAPRLLASGAAVLNGPMRTGDTRPRLAIRLAEKAIQARAAMAGWLRTDLRDGLWQFSEFGSWDLPKKASFVSQYLHQQLQGTQLDGVVLTTGACQAQGRFADESTRLADNALALRRRIGSARVRETIVVPLSEAGDQQSAYWCQLYQAEPDWLEFALESAGLAAVPELRRSP